MNINIYVYAVLFTQFKSIHHLNSLGSRCNPPGIYTPIKYP